MRWEYCATRINTEDEIYAQRRLDGLGADGWELVTMTPAAPNGVSPESRFTFVAILKRPFDPDRVEEE